MIPTFPTRRGARNGVLIIHLCSYAIIGESAVREEAHAPSPDTFRSRRLLDSNRIKINLAHIRKSATANGPALGVSRVMGMLDGDG